MKALLIYFSGTGNTELIADEIVSRLKHKGWDIETVSVEELNPDSRTFNFNLRTVDMLGFGFPVYKFSYPYIMEKIFPFLSYIKPSPKPFFAFSTYCRFTSTSLHRMAAAVEACETADEGASHMPVALRAFKCPSNGIASLQPPESREYREVMYFSPGIGTLLDNFADEIDAGYRRRYESGAGVLHSGSPIDLRRERLVGRIEKSRYPQLSIDAEKCTLCGLCAKKCPEGNLVSSSEDRSERQIEILDAEGCLHCLRCLHICPFNAISFGPLVHGPSRYRPVVRKKLFAEAAARLPGEPEAGTAGVRFRWALGNLVDYLFRKS